MMVLCCYSLNILCDISGHHSLPLYGKEHLIHYPKSGFFCSPQKKNFKWWCVKDKWIFIFGWTVPLSWRPCVILAASMLKHTCMYPHTLTLYSTVSVLVWQAGTIPCSLNKQPIKPHRRLSPINGSPASFFFALLHISPRRNPSFPLCTEHSVPPSSLPLSEC